MTALTEARSFPRPADGPAVGAVPMILGLALLVALRWVLLDGAHGDALAVGAAFGVGVGALALGGGWRPTRPRWQSLVVGTLGGGILVAIALLTRPIPHLWLPAAPFVPWVAITVLVATAEEGILRGVLFTRLADRHGWAFALTVTTIAFALAHVPLYGWQVVPLDLGVGLWLGGLRLATGGVAGPAVAHAVADLATWWL